MLIAPIAHLAAISRAELNVCLVKWGHRMGPWKRPDYGEWFHALFHNGDLVAVTAAGSLIRDTCAGLTRIDAVELGRMCAVRPHLCRPMLRLWREFVFPDLCRAHSYRWAVSYQDAVMHTGDLYRFDGWVALGRSRSGTDQRTGRKGRDKVIWGFCADPAEMLSQREAAS
jgi:hypothetical protein